MHGRGFILRKPQARTRNCILGQRSGMEGTRDGLQQEERVKDMAEREGGGPGLGCTMALFVTMTNESNRFRVVYGF